MKELKKILALLLSVIMVVTLMPTVQKSEVNAAVTTTRYEAEDADITNARPVNTAVGSAASGSKAVPIRPTQSIKFTVNVTTAGTYTIPVRYATGNSLAYTVIPMEIIVNNESQKNYDFANTGSEGNTNGYKTFATQEIELSLVQGENTIEIKNVAEGDSNTTSIFANIDYIEISENSNPNNYPEAVGKHEAEDAVWNAETTDIYIQEGEYYSTCSNGKAVGINPEWQGNILTNERYIYQTVYAETAGTYKLTLAYCTGNKARLAAKVNDGEYTYYSEADSDGFVPASEGWNVAATVTQLVTLAEGENTIYLSGAIVVSDWDSEQTGVNLDYFTLEAYTAEEEVIPDAIGKHEAENATLGSAVTLQNSDYYASCSNGAVVGIAAAWNGNTLDEGKYIMQKVNAAEAGEYILTVAYATTGTVELLAKVNDADWTLFDEADSGTKVLPASGGWITFANATQTVTLTEGANTIYLSGSIVDWNANWQTVYNGEWGNVSSVNLDYFTLEKVSTPEPTKYEVSIDGTGAVQVEENGTCKLPTTAEYGYYDAASGKAYPAGSEVTVTDNMALTSIADLTVSATGRAGIRLGAESGIRFEATVSASNTVALENQDVIQEGVKITVEDYLDSGKEETLEIKNTGWLEGAESGTYCGSVVGIDENNYTRKFVAKAYAYVVYADGSKSAPVESTFTIGRSVQEIAEQVKKAEEYQQLSAANQQLIDAFAAAK